MPRSADLDWSVLDGVQTLGHDRRRLRTRRSWSQELLERIATRYTLEIEERQVTQEDVVFKLPVPLAGADALAI